MRRYTETVVGVQAVRTCAIGRDRERWTFKGKERESSGKEGGKIMEVTSQAKGVFGCVLVLTMIGWISPIIITARSKRC